MTRTPSPDPSRPGGVARRPGSALAALGLSGLYLIGLGYWVAFFCPVRPLLQGNPSLELAIYDWPKEVAHAQVIRDALADGRIPYHVDDPSEVMYNVEDGRFLGLPESILSPQILLLTVMPPGPFLLAHTLLLYSIGFAGSLALRRRFGLGPLAFATFFVLFNLNGYIAAHLAVGHSMWAGYFLLPWFVLCLLGMLDGPGDRAYPLGMAALLFAMLLQGALHMVIWCGIFLVLLVLANPGYWRHLALILGSTGLMSAFRLVPGAFAYRHHGKAFTGGYRDLVEMARGFLRYDPGPIAEPFRDGLGWWEFDLYVGLLGLATLLYFGVVQRLAPSPAATSDRYPQLDVPLVLMTLLSIGAYYRVVFELPLPLVKSERGTSRFLIIPVVVLMALSAIRLDRVLRHLDPPARGRLVCWALVLEMLRSMVGHARYWRIPRLSEFEASYLLPAARGTIVSLHDPVYEWVVNLSFAVSAIACLAWALAFARSRRARHPHLVPAQKIRSRNLL